MNMTRRSALLLALGTAACGRASGKRETTMAAQNPPAPQHSGDAISIMKVHPLQAGGDMAVNSSAIGADGVIADRHSAYHDNLSPPLSWNRVEGAAAYAVIVEDPDAPRDQPFVHWLAWNIPGDVTGVPEGIGNVAHPASPQHMIQGRNDSGTYGWFGPRPPPGHGPHRYHFQVFALAKALPMSPEAPLRDVVQALKGDTLAEGEVVGTYEAPASQ
jgi:Raf kinase inhibitor-like YbhB/YbcL family protein